MQVWLIPFADETQGTGKTDMLSLDNACIPERLSISVVFAGEDGGACPGH